MAEPLSKAQQRCWHAFIESSLLLHSRLEDNLRATTDLSMSDYQVMVVLSEAPEYRVRMGELANRLVFSPSRLTYHFSTMVKRGLVRRQSCLQDGRGQEAVLTQVGLSALRDAAPQHLIAVRDSFIDDLDDTEIAVITRVFGRLGPRLRSAPELSAKEG